MVITPLEDETKLRIAYNHRASLDRRTRLPTIVNKFSCELTKFVVQLWVNKDSSDVNKILFVMSVLFSDFCITSTPLVKLS